MATKSVKRRQPSASKSKKSSTSNTLSASTTARPMMIQREINKDYKILFKDYKKLSLELWKMPATKYILGGIAASSLVPVMMKVLRSNPKIKNLLRRNVDVITEKAGAVGDVINDQISNLRNRDDVDSVEARH